LSTLQRIKKLFLENYDVPEERLQPETTIDGIGLDSLDKIDFLFALEKEFNIKIPERGLTLTSIHDVTSAIEKLVYEQHRNINQKEA
jgi:acyl carrier protein